MKKTFLLLNILLLGFILNSCTKKEPFYSCSPQLNSWAEKNSNNFHGINRRQLATLHPALQKVVYRMLTPENKLSIWKEKLLLVKASSQGQQRIKKIEQLIDRVHISWFNKPIDKPLRAIDEEFLTKWENELLSDGSIDSIAFVIDFCTFMTRNDVDTFLLNPTAMDTSWLSHPIAFPEMNSNLKAAPIQDCSCRYNIYCNIFFAGECKQGGCFEIYDCGLLGGSKCIGLCPEEIID